VQPNDADALILVSQLSKYYVTEAEEIKALDNITCELPLHQMTALQGASGSGKSTLLNLIGALDRPTSGEIRVGDTQVDVLRGREETAYRRQEVGFVFQDFSLIPYLTALENVMLPMELTPMHQRERQDRANMLLEQVGIPVERRQHRPNRLSGGQQQRVAIARALANQPAVILADEPTANLDSTNGRRIVDLLRRLCTSGQTVVLATHNNSVARACDLVIRLRDGQITDVQHQ
jgi:putative ABC transport system ATP-binding protein